MNIQRMQFVTDAERMCNSLLVRLLLVLGGVNLKDLHSHFTQLNLLTISRPSQQPRVGYLVSNLI
jgi:hypothetical protein